MKYLILALTLFITGCDGVVSIYSEPKGTSLEDELIIGNLQRQNVELIAKSALHKKPLCFKGKSLYYKVTLSSKERKEAGSIFQMYVRHEGKSVDSMNKAAMWSESYESISDLLLHVEIIECKYVPK